MRDNDFQPNPSNVSNKYENGQLAFRTYKVLKTPSPNRIGTPRSRKDTGSWEGSPGKRRVAPEAQKHKQIKKAIKSRPKQEDGGLQGRNKRELLFA